MKTISTGLSAHLAGEVTTLASCWRVTRRDGVVLGFTDPIRDLEIEGVTYRAASGYTRTAIRSTADLAVDNLDVESVFADDGITEEDLRTGRYDFAEIRMFLVNDQDLSQGIMKLRRGWLGEVSIRHGIYAAELRGLAQKLQMTVGEIFAPDCLADLGDARCGVDLVALEEVGTGTAVTSITTFETNFAQATGWYNGGELLWTSGANCRADRRGPPLECRDRNAQPVPTRSPCHAAGRCLHHPPGLRQELRYLPGEVRQLHQLPRLSLCPRHRPGPALPDAYA
jgi:uncharacterized phage protein (TIGR02218 family)